MKLADEVLGEIRYRVVQGFDNRDEVFDWILGNYPQKLGITKDPYGPDDLDAETAALLRDVIEAAFADKAKEMASWPAATDCDRLKVAFDALDEQGIVALESPGLTQDDSIPRAAEIAEVRDELGGEAYGYCFFTWNDLARAIDGEGLSLAYGTFKDEPPQPKEAPAECPICKGRGWITAGGPSDFPKPCACRSVTGAAAPRPNAAPTLGQKVGAAVLEACRGAGLDAEWSGSPSAFVELPRFRWQRRLVVSSESDVRDFLEGWSLEIRAGYLGPDEMLGVLDERARDWFGGFSDFGPRLWSRLRVSTDRCLEEEQALESRWLEPTTNDRITGAFDELNRAGVLARECLGLTIQDGWGYAGVKASPEHRGVAFFHQEDVIDAVGGRGLLIAFGSIGVEGADDDKATAALGRTIVATLERHGVSCRWSESLQDRIRIEPFEWQRRRWTKAPPYEKRAAVAEGGKRPSFLSRLFGQGDKRPTTRPPPPETKPTIATNCGAVVRALRDERGFDVRRARQMRAAWKALGNAGDAQVGHVGLPHVFVRAGGFTSMAPQLATWNLRAEKDEVLRRGMAARSAKG